MFLLKNELIVKDVSLLEFQLVQHHGGGRTISRLRLSVVDGAFKLSLPSDVQTILLAEKRTNEESASGWVLCIAASEVEGTRPALGQAGV